MTPMELMQKHADVIEEQCRTQSPELTAFYKSWWERKDMSDAVDHEFGLCRLASVYTSYWGGPYIRGEMVEQFIACGLNESFPFGKDAYVDCRNMQTMNKDPSRLEWVRLHIPELNT